MISELLLSNGIKVELVYRCKSLAPAEEVLAPSAAAAEAVSRVFSVGLLLFINSLIDGKRAACVALCCDRPQSLPPHQQPSLAAAHQRLYGSVLLQ